jgi:hypothetical protein
MWLCRVTQVRFARFWERLCPILGADLEAASSAASRNCLTGHGVKGSGAGCVLPSKGRSFAQRSQCLSDIRSQTAPRRYSPDRSGTARASSATRCSFVAVVSRIDSRHDHRQAPGPFRRRPATVANLDSPMDRHSVFPGKLLAGLAGEHGGDVRRARIGPGQQATSDGW